MPPAPAFCYNQRIETPDQTAAPFAEHLLAAIVFTDVVDYSARMERESESTLLRVGNDFEKFRRFAGRYRGKVHNTMGDGMLLCFNSATNAVIFALRVQKEFATRLRTDPDALRHRIGIHVGDIVVTGNNVAGDGVNVASRVMTLAPPGGICVTEAMYKLVKNHLRLKADPLGTPELKNISEPIPVHRLDIAVSRLPMRSRIPKRSVSYSLLAVLGGTLLLGLGWWLGSR